MRPQYHCCKQEDDKHNTLTPSKQSTPLVDLLTRIKESISFDILIHSPLISFSSQLSVGKHSNRDTTHQSTHKHPTNSNANCHLKSIMSKWKILPDCQNMVTSFHFLTNDNKCAARFLIGYSHSSVKAADAETASISYPKWSLPQIISIPVGILELQLAH